MAQKKRPIKIGIDIRDLREAKTGQKTVTEELCKQFAASKDPELTFVFFDSAWRIYGGQNKWLLILKHIHYQYWKQVVLPVKAWLQGCDILFCGDYFVPYLHLGFQPVEIFYDAFFFEYPEHYNKSWLKLFHHIAMPSAKRCSRIMTITEYSKNKLHELAGFPLGKLVTVYPAAKSLPAGYHPDSVQMPVAEGRKYILHVGVMEKRKNIPSLIRAFHQLTKYGYGDIDLVLVGQGNGKTFSDDSNNVFQTIRECELEKRVICTGYLPDDVVAGMYKNAFLYVFPSTNEGFGIPILEAFRFDVPVLVADNSCLPEVGGNAVITFNPYDTGDICNKMRQVIDNEDLRKDLISKGRERLQLFSWEKAAQSLADVFKTVANERR